MNPTHVFHRHLLRTPPVAVRGQGVWLEDAAGKRYIDASGGAAVSCLGHGHPTCWRPCTGRSTSWPTRTPAFTTEVAEALSTS